MPGLAWFHPKPGGSRSIVEAHRDVGVLEAKMLFINLQGAPQMQLGLFQLPGSESAEPRLLELHGHGSVAGAMQGFLDHPGTPVGSLGLQKPPLLLVKPPRLLKSWPTAGCSIP